MKLRKIFRAVLAALVATGSALVATSSFAGAVVYRDNYDSGLVCDSPSIPQTCFQLKGRWHQVSTPSGNVTYSMKGTAFISVSDGLNSSQTTVDASEKMLFKSGQPHNGRSSTTTEIVNSGSGQCTRVTIEYDYGFANGNVTKNNDTFTETTC